MAEGASVSELEMISEYCGARFVLSIQVQFSCSRFPIGDFLLVIGDTL